MIYPEDYKMHLRDAKRYATYAMRSTAPGREHIHIQMAQTALDLAKWSLTKLRRAGKMKRAKA